MKYDGIGLTLLNAGDLSETVIRLAAQNTLGIAAADGMLTLVRGGKAFRCADTPEGYELLSAIAEGRNGQNSEDTELLALLSGEMPLTAEETKRFGFDKNKPICVIALETGADERRKPDPALRELIPMEKEDRLLALRDGRTVLIKRSEDEAEAAEFALALTGTVEDETGIRLKAGISNCCKEPGRLPEAFREALSALRIGSIFRMPEPVYLYREQVLERLLSEIPEETRTRFRKSLICGNVRKTLNEETLNTAEAFFKSDLNLSDTARQLFIHRNTLLYRLEKIRKETGLDLRKFNDAVAFKILILLPD